jgi:hypothetical protein
MDCVDKGIRGGSVAQIYVSPFSWVIVGVLEGNLAYPITSKNGLDI